MSPSPNEPAATEPEKKKWMKPLITVIVLIGVLILLTDGELLEPFVYSNF